ncbi:MAG: hypothetical protein ACSHX0_00765 [Akkermansiaceae bacterium]
MTDDLSDKNWVETSASFAPAMLGTAAGILIGDLIHRDSRRPFALILAAVGVCTLAPSIVGIVADKVNGPNTRRGNRRTLRNIRDAGLSADEFSEIDEDQMFIG